MYFSSIIFFCRLPHFFSLLFAINEWSKISFLEVSSLVSTLLLVCVAYGSGLTRGSSPLVYSTDLQSRRTYGEKSMCPSAWSITSVRSLHPRNAQPLTLVTFADSSNLDRLLHPSNVYGSIEVTPEGIFISFKLTHPINAPVEMEVTLVGIFMLFKLTHQEKASLAMDVTLVGIFTFVRLSHLENAPYPISVTLAGISMLFSFLHPLNA